MKYFFSFARLLALLLTVQFAGLMTAEAAHAHDSASPVAAVHCELCQLAHVPQAADLGALARHSLGLVCVVQGGAAQPGSRFVTLTRFSRPPPSAPGSSTRPCEQ